MNAEFAPRGVDAVAVSADVAPADLGGFARGLRGWRNLAGRNSGRPPLNTLNALALRVHNHRPALAIR
jgi:hypothetical protein